MPDPANATAISSFTGFPALHAGAASGWVAVFKVDLDEAVHGLYGTARTAMEALLKGRSEILQSWAADAYQLGYRTIEWLRAQETPSVFGVAVAAVTLPLAVLAVIGGIGEINEGGDALRRLRAEEKCLLAAAAAAAAVAPRVTAEVERGAEPGKGEAVANVEAKVEPDASGDADGEASDFRLAIDARYRKSRLAQIGREKAVAVADVQVGAASTGAGVLIAVKAASEIALQVAVKVLAKGAGSAAWLAQSPAGTLTTTIISGVGAMVLAPVAALFALGLGSVFVHRSRIGHRDFLQARKHLLTSLPDMATDPVRGREAMDRQADRSEPAATKAAYVGFVRAKLEKRAGFMERFRNWNVAFLSGTVLYGGATLAKAALIGAGLLGMAAIASNPVALAIIIAITAIGAIAMAVSSYNFLFNHGRNKRHEGFDPANDVLFLGPVMTLIDSTGEATGHEGKGFAHRAEMYRAAQGMEQSLNALVDRFIPGDGGGKANSGAEPVSTEPASGRAARKRRSSVRASTLEAGLTCKHAIAVREAMLDYLKIQLRAVEASKALWADLQGNYKIPPLLAQASTSLDALIMMFPPGPTEEEFAKGDVDLQLAWETAEATRLATRDAGLAEIIAIHKSVVTETPDAGDSPESADSEGVHATFVRLQDAAHKARRAYTRLAVSRDNVVSSVEENMQNFLAVQAELGFAAPYSPDDDAVAAFANFLLKQAPAAFATMRGNLLAAELQAARRAMDNRPAVSTSASTPADAI